MADVYISKQFLQWNEHVLKVCLWVLSWFVRLFLLFSLQRSSSTSCLRLWRCWQTPPPRWDSRPAAVKCFYTIFSTPRVGRSAPSAVITRSKLQKCPWIKTQICVWFSQAAYDKVRAAKKQAEERNRKLDDKRKKIKLGQLIFCSVVIVTHTHTHWVLFCVL